MNVSQWKTPSAFFPWGHVQFYIDSIDSTVYHVAIDMAQELHLAAAKPCPGCGRAAADLFWFSVSSPQEEWDAGTGEVGFMTICVGCKIQVEFLVDAELTQMQAEQWREHRSMF